MKDSRIMLCAALLASLGLCASSSQGQTVSLSNSVQPVSSVPAPRLAHLRRGVNASAWFAQVYDKRGYTKEHFQDWTTAQDIALIKSMGFDHLRLSVNPQPMMPNHPPHQNPAEYPRYIDT